jgi:hypothetical protein
MTLMSNSEAVDRVWDVMHKRKMLNDIEKLVRKNIATSAEETTTSDIKNIWFALDGVIHIGEATFQFRDKR